MDMKRLIILIICLCIYQETVAQQLISKKLAVEQALERNYSLQAQKSISDAEGSKTLEIISPQKTELSYYEENTPSDMPGHEPET